ncbi:AMP-binding protein [Streptomyces sp. NPDC058272]|uniref:AMP-binding protein n=1 Tax=Streptomyces sp. NPDC058272 TaxID=3346415 RepID=UPI0036F11641
MNLASHVVNSARIHPDRPALRLGDAAVSYRALDQGSARMAGVLHDRGVKPGDRVAVMLPNVPEFALAYFGVLRAGGIVVPMNPLLKSREVAYYLGDSGARLLFAWHTFADEARTGAQQAEAESVVVSPGSLDELLVSARPTEHLTDRHEDDTAVILYTSGTTGQPKGAELTHAAGACLTLLPRFDAGKALGIEGYGTSETSPVASFNTLQAGPKPGSVGIPIRGVEMRVVDKDSMDSKEVPHGETGEITIRGHNVMKRYWQRPEATAAAIRDGWFYTGDIGRVDQDGYFWIVGRTKDVIIRGGYNVYPREVEDVLYEHPAVADAAVIGVPNSDLGEEVGAAVVLKPGAHTTAEDLRDYVKGQVAAYKYPRKVWITDALPKGPTGKILKREIVPPPEAARDCRQHFPDLRETVPPYAVRRAPCAVRRAPCAVRRAPYAVRACP